ncbi:MAG: L-fucose:H+ symporter permease [Flavobacteriales bacterium]|nr:L-fucose:H+ symporter permease [Flavobacteriales bacterium]
MEPRSTRLAIVLVTGLFFLWALAHNLNPILIPHLRRALQLTDLRSALVDSAFFIAYFVMALPAGALMARFGYRSGIVGGLLLFAIGALLFWPAATLRSYPFFLSALFIIASGLTFLETAANPYITALGDPTTAHRRLNFAQAFNGLGAALAAFFGGRFILSGEAPSEEALTAMAPAALDAFLAQEALAVRVPYLIIALVVLLAAVLFLRVPLPTIHAHDAADPAEKPRTMRRLWAAVAAQFCYVGAQVGVGSFFIRFAGRTAAVGEQEAAYLLSIGLLLFMAGRFIGTALLRSMHATTLLGASAAIAAMLAGVAVLGNGVVAVVMLIALQLFMSIMFPTIFSLGIEGLGSRTKLGSSLLVMSIAGGAVIPPLVGAISDRHGIQLAYLVPLGCFLAVLFFARTAKRLPA